MEANITQLYKSWSTWELSMFFCCVCLCFSNTLSRYSEISRKFSLGTSRRTHLLSSPISDSALHADPQNSCFSSKLTQFLVPEYIFFHLERSTVLKKCYFVMKYRNHFSLCLLIFMHFSWNIRLCLFFFCSATTPPALFTSLQKRWSWTVQCRCANFAWTSSQRKKPWLSDREWFVLFWWANPGYLGAFGWDFEVFPQTMRFGCLWPRSHHTILKFSVYRRFSSPPFLLQLSLKSFPSSASAPLDPNIHSPLSQLSISPLNCFYNVPIPYQF